MGIVTGPDDSSSVVDGITQEIPAVVPVQEVDPSLQAWANKEHAALFAFIAPYSGVRVSPVMEAYASIGWHEEFGIESFLEECASAKVRKLHLLVNSPGGSLVSSYKVAKALRSQFDQIRVFVPHMAASGGTLLALTGNDIVMGLLSHLTPLDPQVEYKGTSVSCASFMRAFDRFYKAYSKLQAEEAPYPVRHMTEKLDPVIMEEMSGSAVTCVSYVSEILRFAGYEAKDARTKATKLVSGYYDHGTVLGRDLLIREGFKVIPESRCPKEWAQMRMWLRRFVGRSESVHHMRYCLPDRIRSGLKQPSQTKTKRAVTRKKRKAR